ncbi:hypothetical protein F5888DRAFT_1754366, partial [Russula emetica]
MPCSQYPELKPEMPIVNSLNKTRVERVVNHEAERIDRVNARMSLSVSQPRQEKKADLELADARRTEKVARLYDSFQMCKWTTKTRRPNL